VSPMAYSVSVSSICGHGLPEPTFGGEVGAGSVVELGDGVMGEGDHHGVDTAGLGGGPVGDHLIEEDIGVGAES
jgi:hypothetical protein